MKTLSFYHQKCSHNRLWNTTFQYMSLFRLATIHLQEPPKSKTNLVKHNCASLWNILNEWIRFWKICNWGWKFCSGVVQSWGEWEGKRLLWPFSLRAVSTLPVMASSSVTILRLILPYIYFKKSFYICIWVSTFTWIFRISYDQLFTSNINKCIFIILTLLHKNVKQKQSASSLLSTWFTI